jgi:uncharacterized protein
VEIWRVRKMDKVGKEHLRSRRQIYEGDGVSPPLKFKVQILKWLVWKILHLILKLLLKAMGLFERGRENALSIEVKNRVFKVEGLSEELEGFRILFMSDLHFERRQELTDAIVEKIHSLKVDLCLFGGDFQRDRSKFLDPAIEGMKKIVGTVEASFGFYAVLGNHDTIELVSELESIGVHVLMNESIKLEKNFSSLYVVGVDDPFYFGYHDIEKAFKNVPEKAFKIFLSHTPDLYKQASLKGVNFYLCGHTHHGQVQFPLIGPLLLNIGASRKLGKGEWRYENMTGFTGPGVGTSGTPVRFNCSPEITVLELKSPTNG